MVVKHIYSPTRRIHNVITVLTGFRRKPPFFVTPKGPAVNRLNLVITQILHIEDTYVFRIQSRESLFSSGISHVALHTYKS